MARRSRERTRQDGRPEKSSSAVERRTHGDSSRRSRSRSRARSPSRITTSRPSHSRRSRSRSRSPRGRRSASRSRSRSHDRGGDHKDRHRKRKRSRSRSVSSQSSASSHHKRHRKKDKHRKRSSRSRERKEKKKKKDKKKKHAAADVPQWGKYGIISEIDIFTKGPEFHTWLVEERKINPENMSKDQNKKEFARFMEDYNTATLPHEKYYHMEAYEKRMAALRAGEFLPPSDDFYDPAADMRAHQSRLKKQAVEQDSYLSKDELLDLRRVLQERDAVGKMKVLGMDLKQNMGVRMDGTMFDD